MEPVAVDVYYCINLAHKYGCVHVSGARQNFGSEMPASVHCDIYTLVVLYACSVTDIIVHVLSIKGINIF